MTDLALAPVRAAAPATGALSAAGLAARIEVPRRLPVRYDGQPTRHLSNSSYTLFLACPDAWRRRYLLGEKEPPSGAMFLGSRVDETLSHYYRHWLEHRERVELRELERFFGANWKQQLAAENDKLGVAWDERLDRHTALKLGVNALTIAFEELVPRLGEPVAVQRRVESSSGSRPRSSGRSRATSTSRPAARSSAARKPSRRSSTTRSRPAARSPRRSRRATRRPACTSPPAGLRAGPPHGSSSRRR